MFFYRKEYKGLKNHYLKGKRRIIVCELSVLKTHFWKNHVFFKTSSRRKVSLKVVQNIKNKMERLDNFCLQLRYNGKKSDITCILKVIPLLTGKKVSKTIFKKFNREKLLTKRNQLSLAAVRYFFNVNVTLKNCKPKIKKEKTLFTNRKQQDILTFYKEYDFFLK